jgi:hypothetical protein
VRHLATRKLGVVAHGRILLHTRRGEWLRDLPLQNVWRWLWAINRRRNRPARHQIRV